MHQLTRAHVHVADDARGMLIPYLPAETECVWLMKVGGDNFPIWI